MWYNAYDLLLKIYFYYNSKFQTGEVDVDGDRKFFYNIVKNPCMIFSKAIDFDTKNIRMLTAGGGDPLKTWFMERDLKYWMRDKQFGQVLNRIFHELPIYGSVVLKIVKGSPFFVDLRNFIVDPSADSLDTANYITEIHHYTAMEFRKVAKGMNWPKEKVNEVIDKFHQMKDTSHIRLYERYGEVAEEGSKGNFTYPYKRVFIADVGVDEFDQHGVLSVARPGVELSSDEWDGHPYWEFHASKVAGRWLGVGVVETLIEPQVRVNQLANLQAKASYWAALRVFQTRDPAVNRNLATDTPNGTVLNVDFDITQVDMSDRNLAFFNEEHAKWLRNRDDLTIAFAPVGHSVIAIEIAQDQVISYFSQIQETVAMRVKEMLYEVVLPQWEIDSTPEHTLRLIGKDLDEYVEMIKNDLVNKEIVRLAIMSLNGGSFPTGQDQETIATAVGESIKQGKEKLLTVPKGFFKNAKYDIDIDITGESVDVKARYATRFALLQAITADPTVLTDPAKKKILAGMAEDGGIDPNELFGATNQNPGVAAQIPGRAGGGVSAPSEPAGRLGLSQRNANSMTSTL